MSGFILGLLTAVVFFIALISFYFIGYKQGRKVVSKPPDEEVVRKQKKLHENFIKTMNYNEDIARQRKKVT